MRFPNKMFASALLRRYSCVSLSLVRRKSFVSALRPSLNGSVLQNVIYRRIFNDLSSSSDNLAKKFLIDYSTIAVFSTAEKLADKLEAQGIEYAFVGGLALNVHGFKRQITDVDVLVTSSGLQKFKDTIVHSGVAPRFRGAERSFRDPVSNVGINLLVVGDFSGDGMPKDVAFPEPISENITDMVGVKVINLQQLITLKLAAYLSRKQARMKDRTDVAGLVKYLSLGTEFAERLPESVRGEFIAVVENVVEEEEVEQKHA